MRFTYKNKTLIVSTMREAKKELWRFIELQKTINKISWSKSNKQFSLKNYQKDIQLFIKINLTKDAIDLLSELTKSKSQYADFEELIRDLDWIKQYYKEKKWSSVIRWLSNTESSLHSAFSDYMDEIKDLPNYQQKNYSQHKSG